MRVVFVQAAAQLQALKQKQPDVLQNAVAVGLAPNLSLWRAAEQAGIKLRPYTDFVTFTTFCEAMEEARRTSRSWFGDLGSFGFGSELFESMRLEMLQSLSEIFLTQRVVSQVLDLLAPAEVLLAAGLDLRVAGVAEFEAEQRAIPVLSAGPGQPRRTREPSWRKLARLVRQLAHNAGVLAAHRGGLLVHPQPTLLSFGAGVDSVNQQQLMPSVAAAGVARPILVRSGAVNPTMFNRSDRSSFTYLHFLPMHSMLRAGRFVALARQCWEAFRQRAEAYQGHHAFLFSNRYLRPFWERTFLHLLPHAMATQLDVRALLRRLRPALVLTSNEVSFPVRALVLEARHQGIPTLGLIHSGLNHMHYRDFGSDRMAVWGSRHVSDFVRVLGKEPSQLCPIGNPLYDTLGVEPEAQQASPAGSAQRSPRVLVVTALPQWTMYYFDLRQHLRAWQELERLPELGVQVTIKPHPRFDSYGFYEGLRHRLADWREDRPGIAVALGTFLDQVLPACDLVVVPGFPTTGAVEAMLFRKPVVYLQCGAEEPHFCTSIAAGCEVVREVQRICPTILELLHSPERQAELVHKGQSYLDELLGPRDRHATERFVALIGHMVEAGA